MTSRHQARFRLFAGPNGSGKTTLFDYLKQQKVISTEIYNSPDRIEKDLKKRLRFNFNSYRVKVDDEEFRGFVQRHGLSAQGKVSKKLLNGLQIKKGVLHVQKVHIRPRVASYISSMISAYLTAKLFESGQSFCLETVMSHRGKLDYFDEAFRHGYVSYLYFVYTDDVKINIERVKERVKKKGHSVQPKKIRERYLRSFRNLKPAMALADKAFIVDNSSMTFETMLMLDRVRGRLSVRHPYPAWLKKYCDPLKYLSPLF
ncbi:MAG: hypothetical protein KF789_11550 [Bdellovibrionaceae bacterium]|nr:hypothetical protein [Pseudobdellovibrionaceae bacterium]